MARIQARSRQNASKSRSHMSAFTPHGESEMKFLVFGYEMERGYEVDLK